MLKTNAIFIGSKNWTGTHLYCDRLDAHEPDRDRAVGGGCCDWAKSTTAVPGAKVSGSNSVCP